MSSGSAAGSGGGVEAEMLGQTARESGATTTTTTAVRIGAHGDHGGYSGSAADSGDFRKTSPSYTEEAQSMWEGKGPEPDPDPQEQAARHLSSLTTVLAAPAVAKKVPASALRGPTSFGTRARRSVSFADRSDSSDFDSRAYDDGRSAYVSGATLRQVRISLAFEYRVLVERRLNETELQEHGLLYCVPQLTVKALAASVGS